MGLNVKKIKEHTGYSNEEIAEVMGISTSELSDYENGIKKISQLVLDELAATTGLSPSDISTDRESHRHTAENINPINTWTPSRTAKNNLVEYIKEGLSDINENDVQTEIKKIEHLSKSLRKPKVAFAGFSDVGKSTMINILLGVEHMPSKWTPTTAIVVYIKHVSDKPTYIKDNVWIFSSYQNDIWNDTWLSDEDYTKKFYLAAGDYDILEQYGTHHDESNYNKAACAAVVFIDSPLLEDCDILDLPGFGATDEDDALQIMKTQNNRTDILIYLSRANGFLQDRDKDYLNLCINSLNPIEKSGENNIKKLENLFIIASQANAVNSGNFTELKEIMDKQCHAFCKVISGTGDNNLFSKRSEITGYSYNEKNLRSRFFTYEKLSKRLCKDFDDGFKVLVEKIPKVIYDDFCRELTSLSQKSSTVIKNKIIECQDILNKREQYLELLHDIAAKEPARKTQQLEKNRNIINLITSLSLRTKQDYQSFYNGFMTEENIISSIEQKGYKNTKSDKNDIISYINNVLSQKCQDVISEHSKTYANELNSYLKEYSNTISKYNSNIDININFDAFDAFSSALVTAGATGVVGASAIWLATSFTAWSTFALGTYAGAAAILSTIGVIAIGVGALAAGIIAAIKAINWKKDVAKKIIKSYSQENFIENFFEESDKYWEDTKISFNKAIEKVEQDWSNKISEYKKLAKEDDIGELRQKIEMLEKGEDFFKNLPFPNKDR